MLQTIGRTSTGASRPASEQDPVQLQKIDRAYSSPPWWYDLRGFLILTFSYRSTLPSQIRHFSRNFGRRHLEAAVGSGTLLGIILRWQRWRGAPRSQIVAFDYSERMLAGARRRFQGRPDIQLLREDVGCLGLSDASFDTANIANAIHCFPDVGAGLREIHRVLKPGGTLAGNVLLHPAGGSALDRLSRAINRWGMRKGILHRPYSQEEVRKDLLDAGFRILEAEVRGNCLNFVALKPSQRPAGNQPLTPEYDELFSRNIGLVSELEQERLRSSCVAIAGLGGAGGIYAITLARMGVGRFHLSDLDTFEPANFNRQACATIRTLGRKKTEAAREMILDINPEAEVTIFEGGVREENVAGFLDGADVVMDALDFFALDARRLMIPEAEKRGIHVITSGPIGMTTTLHVFGPGAMPFERYFDFSRCRSRDELLAAFVVGLTPRLMQLGQVDLRKVSFRERKVPSIVTAIQLCSGFACNEALQILLRRRRPFLAPRYAQFDPVRVKLSRGRLLWGNRGIVQRIKRRVALMLLERAHRR